MPEIKEFVVIDTEGRETLSEIAIINSQGKLIYEAFSENDLDNYGARLNVKPLKDIVIEVLAICQDKLIVCHNVAHDHKVLQRSCQSVGIKWTKLSFACSLELAQEYYPNLASYSLEYLSKKLSLKVSRKYFNPRQAHSARYDAEFTYQLYYKMRTQKMPTQLQNQPNPFGSNRVDNPFQDHLDVSSIYQGEFALLKSIIGDIRQDINHQSKGAIVTGKPGSGKTHLMMRLAKELLTINRLLFIRHPNNPDAILYHIYSRILESFIRKVPETGYTQIEHLLAHSFVKLISQTTVISVNQKDRDILSAIKNNPLDLYESLGAEGTARKQSYWQHIEKRTNEWWMNIHGIAGYSPKIIKGIIKFCSYTDSHKQELAKRWLSADELSQEELTSIGLDNWNEGMSKEDFSLEAIAVFSKLSLLDEPLIIVFDQLESLGLEHNRTLLLSFGEAVKELFTHVPNSLIILNLFPERWQQFQSIFDKSIIDRVSQYKVHLEKPNNQKLREILEAKATAVGVNINTLFTEIELEQILNHNSIRGVLNIAAEYYRDKIDKILLPKPTVIDLEPKPKENLEQNSDLEIRLKNLEKEISKFNQFFQQLNQVFNTLNIVSQKDKSKELSGDSNIEPKPEPKPEPNYRKIQAFLEENRILVEQEYANPQIITDSDDIGKLTTIVEYFQLIYQFEIDHLKLGKKVLPQHLVIKKTNQKRCIGFLQANGTSFTKCIQNFNELTINHKEIEFQLWRDNRQPEITGKVGKEEIAKLNHTANGKFSLLEKEDRIAFELIYKLIIAIQEKDLEIELEEALEIAANLLNNTWIIKLFT